MSANLRLSSVFSIDPDGQGANANTEESWFQPLVQTIDGEERRIPAPPGHQQQVTDHQLYRVVKVDGHWKIKNNLVL